MVGAWGRVELLWVEWLEWLEWLCVGRVWFSVDVREIVDGGDVDEKWAGGGEAGGDLMSLSFLFLEGVIMEEPFASVRLGFSRLETNSGAMVLCVEFALSPSQFFHSH